MKRSGKLKENWKKCVAKLWLTLSASFFKHFLIKLPAIILKLIFNGHKIWIIFKRLLYNIFLFFKIQWIPSNASKMWRRHSKANFFFEAKYYFLKFEILISIKRGTNEIEVYQGKYAVNSVIQFPSKSIWPPLVFRETTCQRRRNKYVHTWGKDY